MWYSGQKNKNHFYKIDFYHNGEIVTPGVAQFTTKKEAEAFVKKSNRAAKKTKANRTARYRKVIVWKPKKH